MKHDYDDSNQIKENKLFAYKQFHKFLRQG